MARPAQRLYILLLVSALAAVSGCAPLLQRLTVQEYDAPATRDLVNRIARQNSDLQGFKGIGDLRLQRPEGQVTARAAWMGRYPDRLRFELINAGQPMAKLAVDGQWFTLISHADDRFYKTESANPSLKRLVDVPVRADDMIALLSGRIPLADFHYAGIRKDAEGRWVLLLKHWGRTVQRLYLDEKRQRVTVVERYSGRDDFLYSATIGDVRDVDGYEIPFRLRFSDENGSGFSLSVDRYWTDAAIDPSRFTLRPVE